MSGALMHVDARGRAWLAALDPRLKLAWLLALSTLVVLVDSLPALVVLAAAGALPLAGVAMRRRGWLLVLGLLGVTVWATVFSQAIFYRPAGESPWGEVLGVRFYAGGAAYGLVQSLRLVSGVLGGLAVCLSTSPERLLAALVRLRVPLAVGFMTVTALRFLPVMLDEMAAVRRARALRGYRFRVVGPRGGLLGSLRLELAALEPILAAALRRAGNLATSVASRGFDPLGRRTYYPALRLRGGEQAAILLLIAACLAVAGVKTLYWLAAGQVLASPELEPLAEFARRWL